MKVALCIAVASLGLWVLMALYQGCKSEPHTVQGSTMAACAKACGGKVRAITYERCECQASGEPEPAPLQVADAGSGPR